MNRSLSLLKRAIAIIAFLFGAFNNFLDNYAPPPLNHETEDSGTGEMTTTIAKFITLLLLLFLSLLINNQVINNKTRKIKSFRIWIWVLGIFLLGFIVISFDYQKQYVDKTFTPFGNDRYIRGILTQSAMSICQSDYPDHDVRSCEIELMNDVGAERMNTYWIPGTRENNRDKLQSRYFTFVILLSALLFSLIELLGLKLMPLKEAN